MYGKVNLNNMFEIQELYTAFHHTYEQHYSFIGEVHDFWEIVIVTDGYVGVTAGSNVRVLSPGQAILHEPMEFHRLWSERNSTPNIIIISFSCKNMPSLKSRLFEIDSLKTEEAINLVDSIKRVFVTGKVSVKGIKKADALDCQIVKKKLEIFILRILSESSANIEIPKSQTAKNYAFITGVLENNIHANLTVSDIAKLCSMSEVNLKKTFFKYSGTGVKSYFNKLKMNEAISLLKSGMTVTETALTLGFSDQNYFSTAFKRIMGKSPTYYKK